MSVVRGSLGPLPVEVLLVVFYYLDVPDILRIRRVSQYLNEISRRWDVWFHAFRNADFPHPPGPFLWPSARDLENTLVRSCRVSKNLRRSNGIPRSVKLGKIHPKGTTLDVSLVFGRFLIVAVPKEVRCYDLDLDPSTSCPSVIYRSTRGILESFHCVSAFDVEGRPFACVVLADVAKAGRGTRILTHLLSVTEQSKVTLDLLHQFEQTRFRFVSVDLGPRVLVVQGRILHDNMCIFALDVHTRTELFLPPHIHTAWDMNETQEWMAITPFVCISSSTHLIFARDPITAPPRNVHFQAFALPFSNTDEHPTPLSASHCGVIPNISVRDAVLLRDAIPDPLTQDTLITISVQHNPPDSSPVCSRYGIIRLCKSHTEPGTIAFQLFGIFDPYAFFYPSFNGTGWMFHSLGLPKTIGAIEYNLHNYGHDDESAEARVVDYCRVLTFEIPRQVVDFDPYSGRICVQRRTRRHTRSPIEVYDFAV